LLTAALAGSPDGHADDGLPGDVRAFVERRIECNHWAGEDAYDAERGRQIAAAVERLRCDRIDRDEARLRRRHSGSARVRRALERARDEVW
jgi:hypothetical protein